MGFELCAGTVTFGPTREPPRGEPHLTQPETSPVVDEQFDGGPSFVAKDEDRTTEWLCGESRPAKLRDAVDALPEIGGLGRNQDPHLWGDLDHEVATMPKKAVRTWAVV